MTLPVKIPAVNEEEFFVGIVTFKSIFKLAFTTNMPTLFN